VKTPKKVEKGKKKRKGRSDDDGKKKGPAKKKAKTAPEYDLTSQLEKFRWESEQGARVWSPSGYCSFGGVKEEAEAIIAQFSLQGVYYLYLKYSL
jgi:hypothetical protein